MQLLNPQKHSRPYPDNASRALMQHTIAFFEKCGRQKLRDNYHNKVWYDDFLACIKEHKLFATLMTPAGHGPAEARWDSWRNCEFSEILGFYGLQYWYTWQVSMLGLGPLWISKNEALKKRTAKLLQEGAIFAFGLSEKEHGADIYATDMVLTPQGNGSYTARGSKYYIGNGNKAAIVSTFGKLADTGEYVFFAADSGHRAYECVQKVTVSQSYVAEFKLHDYPVTPADIIATGPAAWDAALNTINFCKYNLGWASIGICTHAFYEALGHAHRRRLYKNPVTDFPHVKQLFVDAYTRLIAMKAFALRASDYMRSASAQDRRYLLFNPMVKMKVTTQGEMVINDMWDVIAAKGFEKDMYFEEAAAAIRFLPKLEGTVHVNIALIVKFMGNYFFNPKTCPDVPKRDDAANDGFLFDQGPTGKLGDIVFPDFAQAYSGWDTPNVGVFLEQVKALRTLLEKAPPQEQQKRDTGFLLALGDMFSVAVYAQLILENAKIYNMKPDMVEQIFDFLVRDMAQLATTFHGQSAATPGQAEQALRLVRRPVPDAERFMRVWQNEVLPHASAYQPQP